MEKTENLEKLKKGLKELKPLYDNAYHELISCNNDCDHCDYELLCEVMLDLDDFYGE